MVDEVEIDDALVRRLLAAQHPDLAGLPLQRAGHGWDNVLFRLGDDLAVRLPRRIEAAHLVEHEQRWLPLLAADLPLPTSRPERVGTPGLGYPWRWSVVPWFPGNAALETPPVDAGDAADALGGFLARLHRPAPPDAPPNPYRGVALSARPPMAVALERVAARGRELPAGTSREALCDRWSEFVAVPAWPGPPQWLHGDMHPGNLIVDRGRLTGVVDWGDLCAGDPATDLAVGWLALPAPVRPRFRAAYGDVDDDTWARAEGWALGLAVAYLAGSPDGFGLIALAERLITELAPA